METPATAPECPPRPAADPLGPEQAAALAGVLKALADPVRLRLLVALASADAAASQGTPAFSALFFRTMRAPAFIAAPASAGECAWWTSRPIGLPPEPAGSGAPAWAGSTTA